MKKLFLVSALALISTAALAQGQFGGVSVESFSGTAGGAMTGNIGSGFAKESTSSSAWNNSSAKLSTGRHGALTASTDTQGGAKSVTSGTVHRAFGAAGSVADYAGQAGAAGRAGLNGYNVR